MTIVVSAFGILILVMSIWGFVTPKALMNLVSDFFDRPWGIYTAIAIRLALGLVFILAAGETRTPGVINFFGYLMVIAAILIAVLGRRRLKVFVQWWVNVSPAVIRGWLLPGMLFGAFLVYTAN